MNSVNAPYSNNQSPFSPSFDQNAQNAPFGQQLGSNSINPNNLDLFQLQDGNALSQSPNPSQTPFQVPPVVPAKRGRPSDDVTASPRQLGGPGPSRSQTPQQFNQYGAQPGQQPFQTSSPFPQMSHVGSGHASPSPGPQNQMNTPRSFPGQPNSMAQFGQMQNQMNRMGTPQNLSQQQMMRGMNAGPGQSPGLDGNGMASPFPNAPGQGNMNPQQMENMRRQYQAQLARHQQHVQNAQNDQQNPMMTPRGPWPAGMNGQQGFRPGMPPVAGQQTPDAEKASEMQFLKGLRHFYEQRNRTLNPSPRVSGQVVSYYRLFRSFTRINPGATPQGWQAVAASMGFPPNQSPNAGQELRSLFESDLKDFHATYSKAIRDRQLRAGQPPGQMPPVPMQGSPTPRNNDGLSQAPNSNPFSQQNHTSSPSLPRQPNPVGPNHRPSGSQQSNSVDLSAGLNGRPKSASLFSNLGTPDPMPLDGLPSAPGKTSANDNQPAAPATLSKPSADSAFDSQYQPRRRTVTKYGGLDIDMFADVGSKVGDLKIYPRFEELGTTDLHVLNMCLLSGFRAESKYALDRLCALSQTPLRLWECEDLLDSLVQYGQLQIQQMLSSDSDASDTMQVPNFHDTLQAGAAENDAFVHLTDFGEQVYEEDRAVDRLIAVTTILRNLSFPLMDPQVTEAQLEANARVLTADNIKDFIVGSIKCLDPRQSSSLKTARNIQDLMKDLITLLSNISDSIEISSEDQAKVLLEFILAFAPSRRKGLTTECLELTMYNPLKHHYMPCAIDSLAKLLARDDPNRTFYRSLFNADAHVRHPSGEDLLIVRAFSLALAPIPDSIEGTFAAGPANHVAMQRRPFLSQGMLAADILSSLMPQPAIYGFDILGSASLEQALLSSRDGWAPRLLRLIPLLASSDAGMQPVRDRATNQVIDPARPFTTITQRGLSTIRRLGERADRAERDNGGKPRESVLSGLIPMAQLESVLMLAMSSPGFDMDTMKLLQAIATMVR